MTEQTPASIWRAVAGGPIMDELLEWPPDVFALTNLVLGRSEAFRFALAPIGQWPPGRYPDWSDAVAGAARQWSAWVEDLRGPPPDIVTEEWSAFRERAERPLEHNDGRMTPRPHVHDWTTASQHATSEGTISYQRCGCGRWRVRRGTSVRVDQTLVTTPARST
jgi:hypothetical protein